MQGMQVIQGQTAAAHSGANCSKAIPNRMQQGAPAPDSAMLSGLQAFWRELQLCIMKKKGVPDAKPRPNGAAVP
jgi:hypothetical protein